MYNTLEYDTLPDTSCLINTINAVYSYSYYDTTLLYTTTTVRAGT